MEDFEYSVEICDRDWQCFFTECEECNLLPPSLAGLDDSGMSDMDDAGSILAKRAQRVEPVSDRPIDGPPHCEGSPVEHYLSKHGVGGLESVLSGSEEDIHLQSVNLFFEGLKGLAEAEPQPEPRKTREEEEGGCADGQRANGNTLPKNILELNCLPAKGETAVGNEAEKPADTMSRRKTARDEPAPPQTHSDTPPRANLSNVGSMSGTTQQSRPETSTTEGGLLTSQFMLGEKSGSDPTRNPDVKWKENQACSRSDPTSRQWSPASVKRRRRKKRRLSGSWTQQDDSDEERRSSPGNPGSPEDAAALRSGEPQKNGVGSTRCASAGSDETTDNGSTLGQTDGSNMRAASSSANGGTHPQETDCSASIPGRSDEIGENRSKDADAAVLQPPEPNGKCHSAEVMSVSPAHAPAVGRSQNDRRSAAKSGVAGNSEGQRPPPQAEAEPQQQLEIHRHGAVHDGALPQRACPSPSAAAAAAASPAHLPHAEPQLKSRELPFLHDGSCEPQKTDVSQAAPERVEPTNEDSASVSDVTQLSSACSLLSAASLSHENTADSSASFTSSVSEGKSAADPEEGDQKCDLLGGAEESVTSPPARGKNSVFAISSFWSEMEKLTINDILGLRMMGGASPPGFLPPLQESEEADASAGTNEDVSTHPACVESNSLDFSPLKSVRWESEPVLLSQSADLYPPNVSEAPPTVFPVKGLRKLSKNVSVHNLRALESASRTLDRETVESVGEKTPGVTASPPPLTDSYSFSLTDVFQFLFSGKQSPQNQPAPENPACAGGDSLPESYDHFFSEFDTESFFYPFIAAEDREVPIFSCSRSANRILQFPEAYDYFFKSSSSDDSSEDEEDPGPVRVVSRFSRTASSSRLATDMYDNFFTDREDFFWKTTFSFRNVSFSAPAVRRERSNPAALVPVRERRTPRHLDVLGSRAVTFPDPLLVQLEEQISRQLAQRPFSCRDLQTAASSPRLDAPFLPLKQADMCMVCIAFASWVLKTANPQVGDAWKAVLLANVSALSAIRYLRRYVRVEAATAESKQLES